MSADIQIPKDRIRILVVDDDPHALMLVQTMLKFHGYTKCSTTSDPLNAVRKMERGLADIVFLDWNLPKWSGIEILKTLRGHYLQLPVIMFTAENSKENVMEAMRCGASDYIVKPFTRSTLIEKFEGVLNKQERFKNPVAAKMTRHDESLEQPEEAEHNLDTDGDELV